MRILHTSDWHLGRQLFGHSLDTDHEVILEQIFEAIISHKPDLFIIAGDIFDRASPPASAVAILNRFIRRVRDESKVSVILMAGNHDSGERIDAMSTLADEGRALIRGSMLCDERAMILEDEYGPVAITALPFGTEYVARAVYNDPEISCPADVLLAQVKAARDTLPKNARWIVVAHAFVANANPSSSERKLVVGGLETVPAEAFHGAHYVALGHLHRPQEVGAPHVAYSGSPLAFGFDEVDAEKSMRLVDIDKDGNISTELLPFRPKRKMRSIKGQFESILAEAQQAPSDDFIQLVLTDEVGILDPMPRIREFYPNALELRFARDLTENELDTIASTSETKDPVDMISDFLSDTREAPPNDDEISFVETALNELAHEEASQ